MYSYAGKVIEEVMPIVALAMSPICAIGIVTSESQKSQD